MGMVEDFIISKGLPKAAIYYNLNNQDGWKCLEEELLGYRTDEVEGRESLIKELKVVNEQYYHSYKLKPRTLKVTFSLMASTIEKFNDLCDGIKQFATNENIDIYFKDEQKRYTGNVENVEIKPLKSKYPVVATSCTMNFVCTDPHKYSLVTKTVEAEVNEDGQLEAVVENNGNVPCDLDYDIKMNSENGFIGIIGKNGVIQYGYNDEGDIAKAQRSEYLIDIKGQSDFGEKMLEKATKNGTWIQPNISVFWNGQIGTYDAYVSESGQTWNCLRMIDQGSTTVSGVWHGANLCFDVPKTTENVQPQSFEINARTWFSKWRPQERGGACVVAIDENNNAIASMYWFETSNVSYTGRLYIDVANHGRVVDLYNFGSGTQSAAGIAKYPYGGGNITISKTGDRFFFRFMEGMWAFNFSDLKDRKLKKVAIGFYQVDPSIDLVTRLDFMNEFKVIAHNVEYEYDYPNRYQPGDRLVIKGDEGNLYKNNILKNDDEILGTQYFKAEPGQNQITFTYSDWAAQPINAKATIRERWL